MDREIELTEIIPEVKNIQHSPTRGKLFEARAAAQKKIKAIKKESMNPFFKSKYADLQAQIDATADAISEVGLCVISFPITEGQKAGVNTTLGHSSGEWMSGDFLLPVAKADAQGVGSAITYARRYARGAVLDVAAEADDDANAAAGKETEAKAATMPKPPRRTEPPRSEGAITTARTAAPSDSGKSNGKDEIAARFHNHFWATAKKSGKTDPVIREYLGSLGYESTTEIPPTKYAECFAWAEGTQ